MREVRKDSVKPYGFIFDRDVAKAAYFFPDKRTYTLEDLGLSGTASDAEIVRQAWESELIIVTGNGEDFHWEIKRFQQQTKSHDCRELFGLVVLPSGYEIQRRVLRGIEGRLRFGGKRIRWADVRERNLCVRLKKDGSVDNNRATSLLLLREARKLLSLEEFDMAKKLWEETYLEGTRYYDALGVTSHSEEQLGVVGLGFLQALGRLLDAQKDILGTMKTSQPVPPMTWEALKRQIEGQERVVCALSRAHYDLGVSLRSRRSVAASAMDEVSEMWLKVAPWDFRRVISDVAHFKRITSS